jgi:AcrR family transcriptional regulator
VEPSAVGELQRVSERRRAVALARHLRESEGLSVAQIAERVGRSPATIRSYFSDPTGSRARRVKQTYRGVCERCGAATSGDGPGRARERCARCNGQGTLQWPQERIEAALRAWHERYGSPAKSTDLSVSYATAQAPRDGGVRIRRLRDGWDGGRWPALSVVQYHYGTLARANRAALRRESK